MQNNPAVSDLQERVNVALGYLQMIRKLLMDTAKNAVNPDKIAILAPALFGNTKKMQREASITRQQTLNFTSADEQNLLRQIEIAANQARVTAGLVRSRPWSVMHAGIFEEPLSDLLAKGDSWGVWITLSMAFLHACVYYMPTPTLHHLCRDLDVSLTYGGLVFAISDVGEIISSFVYTFWTNKNYKHPLLFSACCGVLGCSLTSLGLELPVAGFPVYLTGRFLIGAASARTICRRYIADCVPLAQRTVASLGMVVASSMGMGIGSLISVPVMRMGNIYMKRVTIEVQPGRTSHPSYSHFCVFIVGHCVMHPLPLCIYRSIVVLSSFVDLHSPFILLALAASFFGCRSQSALWAGSEASPGCSLCSPASFSSRTPTLYTSRTRRILIWRLPFWPLCMATSPWSPPPPLRRPGTPPCCGCRCRPGRPSEWTATSTIGMRMWRRRACRPSQGGRRFRSVCCG